MQKPRITRRRLVLVLLAAAAAAAVPAGAQTVPGVPEIPDPEVELGQLSETVRFDVRIWGIAKARRISSFTTVPAGAPCGDTLEGEVGETVSYERKRVGFSFTRIPAANRKHSVLMQRGAGGGAVTLRASRVRTAAGEHHIFPTDPRFSGQCFKLDETLDVGGSCGKAEPINAAANLSYSGGRLRLRIVPGSRGTAEAKCGRGNFSQAAGSLVWEFPALVSLESEPLSQTELFGRRGRRPPKKLRIVFYAKRGPKVERSQDESLPGSTTDTGAHRATVTLTRR